MTSEISDGLNSSKWERKIRKNMFVSALKNFNVSSFASL